MGKRGPKPKSNEKKALEGNPGQRKLQETPEEVDLSTGSLRIPTRLCTDGKQAWRDLMEAFPDWYFTAADKHLLVMYCEHIARRNKLERGMKREAMVKEGTNGRTWLNPKINAIMDLDKLIIQLSEKLGLTRDRRKGVARRPGEAPPASRPQTPDLDYEQDGDVPVDDVGDLLAPATNVH